MAERDKAGDLLEVTFYSSLQDCRVGYMKLYHAKMDCPQQQTCRKVCLVSAGQNALKVIQQKAVGPTPTEIEKIFKMLEIMP